MSTNPDYFELSKDELILLEKNLSLYEDLDNGRIFPRTIEEKHFVDVCKGKNNPATPSEIAYIKRKMNLIKARENDLAINSSDRIPSSNHIAGDSSIGNYSITSDSIPENEEGYPIGNWFTDSDWKKCKIAQYNDMIQNHKD